MSLTHNPGGSSVIERPDVYTDEKAGRDYEVRQDTDAEDPRAGIPDDDVALWAYREPAQFSSVAAERPENLIIDAFAEFYERFSHLGDDQVLRITRRWLTVFRPEEAGRIDIAIRTIRGYSQSDWLDVVCVASEGYGTAEGHIDEFRQWAFGDVWTVSTDDGSLSGIYADDAEEAVEWYRAHHEPLENRLSEEKAAEFGRFVIQLLNGSEWSSDTPQAMAEQLRFGYGIELADLDELEEV